MLHYVTLKIRVLGRLDMLFNVSGCARVVTSSAIALR